jgi:hypothetical protein
MPWSAPRFKGESLRGIAEALRHPKACGVVPPGPLFQNTCGEPSAEALGYFRSLPFGAFTWFVMLGEFCWWCRGCGWAWVRSCDGVHLVDFGG